jgi:hypothetical protein
MVRSAWDRPLSDFIHIPYCMLPARVRVLLAGKVSGGLHAPAGKVTNDSR